MHIVCKFVLRCFFVLCQASSRTGLLLACRYDHKNIVKTLMERSVNVNKQTNVNML